jgi:hypothetical protein
VVLSVSNNSFRKQFSRSRFLSVGFTGVAQQYFR